MTSQRKPLSVRLSQTQQLISQYDEANLQNHRNYSFISQMETKLKSKRSISKRQRDWLDNLIDEGLPICKNEDLCKKIKIAMEVEEMRFHYSVLESFYHQAWGGKVFSDKQKSYLEGLLSKANDFIRGNFWRPTREQIEDAKLCLKLANDFDSLWVDSHPGFAIAWDEVKNYVSGKKRSISERRFLQFMQWTSRKLNNYKNPRFLAGELAWVRKGDLWRIAPSLKDAWEMKNENSIRVLITSDVYITEKGKIVNDVLIGGSLVTLRQDVMKKRR